MLPLEHKNQMVTCPMCLGKGCFNDDKSRNPFGLQLNKATLVHPKCSLRLPLINSEVKNVKTHPSNQDSEFPTLAATGDVHLPKIFHRTSINKKDILHLDGDNVRVREKNFLSVSAKSEKPQDTLKLALLKLKEGQWDGIMQALTNIVQISRFQPELIDSSMPIVNRSICSLLRNTRSNAIRTACQVTTELFKIMQCTQRPEFDELVGMLLQKAADMNKCIRQDANTALDAMAEYIPPSHCVRVMASIRGDGHKNPLVRTTVSRLLNSIVTTMGVDSLMATTAKKDMRNKIFVMCAKFLLDGNSETRTNAKMLIKLLMTHNDFEHLFNQEVDRKLIDEIKKQLVTLKYNIPNRFQISK